MFEFWLKNSGFNPQSLSVGHSIFRPYFGNIFSLYVLPFWSEFNQGWSSWVELNFINCFKISIPCFNFNIFHQIKLRFSLHHYPKGIRWQICGFLKIFNEKFFTLKVWVVEEKGIIFYRIRIWTFNDEVFYYNTRIFDIQGWRTILIKNIMLQSGTLTH